jgi:hypothetical protein
MESMACATGCVTCFDEHYLNLTSNIYVVCLWEYSCFTVHDTSRSLKECSLGLIRNLNIVPEAYLVAGEH